jgi:hypothetical protein
VKLALVEPVEGEGVGPKNRCMMACWNPFEAHCEPVRVIAGKLENRPITSPEDALGAEDLQQCLDIRTQGSGIAPFSCFGRIPDNLQ